METLRIGSSIDAPGEAAQIRADKFNRHTFWCGQSGSGKTYALGVVLEQLLLHTELPLLILDPNADFVRLNETRPGANAEEAQRLSAIPMRILNSTNPDGERLHARYTDLSVESKAAVLSLDPIADADEYNELLHFDLNPTTFDAATMLQEFRDSGKPAQVKLANRVENLRPLDWELWSYGGDSVNDVVDTRPRVTVMDLGGFTAPAAPKVAALAVLEHLWATRHDRKPILIVIDEAHNICSPHPATAVEKALTEQLVQIAAEGRKFGLWLFLSTQRPTKIHPNVLSQCDNLGLMRINAPRDLAELGEVFGFVPAQMLAQAKDFGLGQALMAGGFAGAPTLVQMRDRVTAEGGSDVSVPMTAGA
ncbi:DNA helicase HerA-like ATPase [Arthrobacter stackebrandtii]|uniref:DNA helicase HerA-like ATPase n=1 Tax=Arthrobacter stackebrandtii TaxID=272161 RepID=A0ABS4Z038_9MICC|nr:ATP-binding protein [Arthrobacter stackebrandtii]MBP2414364.1 DNA helicase HerA-like ATPase [Arthrobacter stackebrandtii]PYH01504.1 ATP-binding protein [Arthrobacter stackebrandtii]